MYMEKPVLNTLYICLFTTSYILFTVPTIDKHGEMVYKLPVQIQPVQSGTCKHT